MGRGPSIEGRKNATDARRGKIFTKIIREISVAARAGGGEPANNPRLRVAIDKGLAANMSKDVIERAIKKATGELEGVADHVEVAASHSGMLFSSEVAQHAIAFLRDGRFPG